jgi:hypothetical protein
VRGSLDGGAFQAYWFDDLGSATAGMHVNDWDAIEPIRRMVELGAREEALAQ